MPLYPGFDICTFTNVFSVTGTSQIWSNTSYWAATSANLTAANVVAGCDAYMTQSMAVLTNIMHETTQCIGVTARIFISGGVIEGVSSHAPIAGSIGDSQMLPLSNVMLVQKRTSVFGRSARGRYFFAGISEAHNDGGSITSEGVTGLKAVATFFGADRTFVVPFHARHWDRKSNTFEAITACRGVSMISTLRSRSRKNRGVPLS